MANEELVNQIMSAVLQRVDAQQAPKNPDVVPAAAAATGSVPCTPGSIPAAALTWNFGDGAMAQDLSTVGHQYTNPGTYEVGGLGACTLISNKALKAGVNFSRMHNLTFWGEDRHFCLRAVSLGFPLYADTRYPAYHIYRESALTGVGEFKRNCGYALE